MAVNKIYMGGDLFIGRSDAPPVEISKEEGNALQRKDDGIYVAEGNVKISQEEGNAIKEKADGLYVAEGSVEISKETGNIIKSKADGIFAKIDATDEETVKEINKIIANNIETENIDFSNFFN